MVVRALIGVTLIFLMLLPVRAQEPPRTAPSTSKEVKGCKYSRLRNDATTVAIVGAEPSHNEALITARRAVEGSHDILVIYQTYPSYGLDEQRRSFISAVIEKSGAGILYHCSSPRDQRMLLERLQALGMLRAQ